VAVFGVAVFGVAVVHVIVGRMSAVCIRQKKVLRMSGTKIYAKITEQIHANPCTTEISASSSKLLHFKSVVDFL